MDPIADGRTVPGFPAYRVTPDGNIWSLYVRGSHRDASCWRLMEFGARTSSYKGKYRRVVLIDAQGKRHSHNVHKLILEAFTGPAPAGMWALHKNGKNFENNIDNLYWGTPTENQMDRFKHGTACEGEDHYLTKLTDEIVTQIRKEREQGYSLRYLARKYDVVRGTISFIVQGKTWKHLLKESGNETVNQSVCE